MVEAYLTALAPAPYPPPAPSPPRPHRGRLRPRLRGDRRRAAEPAVVTVQLSSAHVGINCRRFSIQWECAGRVPANDPVPRRMTARKRVPLALLGAAPTLAGLAQPAHDDA